MSQENVEVLAAGIAALNARDADAIEAVAHDEVEWRPALTAGGHLEGSVYRGRSGMLKYLEDLDSAFDETLFEVEAFEAIGSNHVLYRGRVTARGKTSEVPLEVKVWGLWEIRDGKVFRGAGFLTEGEALEAAARRSVRSRP